jgi:hypothetical protein
MNRKQILAMWLGVALMGSLLLFVPYVMQPNLKEVFGAFFGGTKPTTPGVQYGLLFAPPAGSLGIEWQRVWVPMVFVGLVTLGAIFSLGTRRDGTA